MLTGKNHIIQRQAVRLQLRPDVDRWDVQQRIGRALQQDRLLKALDTVLSAVWPADQWLELERLEVNLGWLHPDRLEEQVIGSFPEALRRQLTDVVFDALFQQVTSIKKEEEIVFEAFTYFLQYGTLPVTALWPEQSGTFDEQLLPLLTGLSTSRRTALKTILANPTARLRLIRQVSETMVLLLLGELDGAQEPVSIRLIHRLQPWRHWLTTDQYETILALIICKTVQEEQHELATLESRLPVINLAKSVPQQLGRLLEVVEPYTFANESVWDTETRHSDQTTDQRNQPEPTKPEFPEPVQSTLSDAFFYVRNAGVVLLHPFLSTCFEACGWLENSTFRNDICREKAVLMIHFLATGESQTAEYNLLLPKVLCQMPTNWPLDGHMRLTEAEQVEGVGLLRAAIDHWSALGNASPDGLREGFLQREGKLETAADGRWSLTVESKDGVDVLLEHLPYGWGVSAVWLPWMDKRLTVNWI